MLVVAYLYSVAGMIFHVYGSGWSRLRCALRRDTLSIGRYTTLMPLFVLGQWQARLLDFSCVQDSNLTHPIPLSETDARDCGNHIGDSGCANV